MEGTVWHKCYSADNPARIDLGTKQLRHGKSAIVARVKLGFSRHLYKAREWYDAGIGYDPNWRIGVKEIARVQDTRGPVPAASAKRGGGA